MSADGQSIAFVTHRGARGRIEVVSAVTGQRRAWSTRLPGRIGGLSWAGDTLAFVWSPARSGPARQVRTVDTRGEGGDLAAASGPVLRLPSGSAAAVLREDGRTVVAGVVTRDSMLGLEAYAPGRSAAVLWKRPLRAPGTPVGLTPDAATGRHMLVAVTGGRLYAGSAQDLREIPARDLVDAAW